MNHKYTLKYRIDCLGFDKSATDDKKCVTSSFPGASLMKGWALGS